MVPGTEEWQYVKVLLRKPAMCTVVDCKID
jgi:hypothetical protein